MQRATFAQTKIQPPRFRAGLIERGELEQRMGTALATRRLVLLIAPAGYGKTAALSRQFRRLPEDCAAIWVTADEEDDLQRFLVCLGGIPGALRSAMAHGARGAWRTSSRRGQPARRRRRIARGRSPPSPSRMA